MIENKDQIIERLKNDEDYYGEFGKQFLSNSDIATLLSNPLALKDPNRETSIPFLVGGYFHTAVLEPDKLKKYKIIDCSTRNTNKYKELSEGELCLLQHEVDQIEVLIDKLLENNAVVQLIREGMINYEVPNLVELSSQTWKCKADVVNHDDRFVIDLKTTNDLNGFRYSAKKYNYDSQAYIYSTAFGYDMIFIAIDKNTGQIGIYDCSPAFYESGRLKVEEAVSIYNLFYETPSFDSKQYFISGTL